MLQPNVTRLKGSCARWHGRLVLPCATRGVLDRVRGKPRQGSGGRRKKYEYGVTYDTSRTLFMRALARAIGAALREVRGP